MFLSHFINSAQILIYALILNLVFCCFRKAQIYCNWFVISLFLVSSLVVVNVPPRTAFIVLCFGMLSYHLHWIQRIFFKWPIHHSVVCYLTLMCCFGKVGPTPAHSFMMFPWKLWLQPGFHLVQFLRCSTDHSLQGNSASQVSACSPVTPALLFPAVWFTEDVKKHCTTELPLQPSSRFFYWIFIFSLIFIFYVYVACLCIMCLQCLWRPEENLDPLGLEL